MSEINYAPVCGIYCGNCEFLGEKCQGCGYVQGKPFWTEQLPAKVCPLYDCCKNQKQLEHCGLCPDFTCKTFFGLRDPNMSDKEFKDSLTKRQKELLRRAEIGTDKWLKEKSSS